MQNTMLCDIFETYRGFPVSAAKVLQLLPRPGATLSGAGISAGKADIDRMVLNGSVEIDLISTDEVEGKLSELVSGAAHKKTQQDLERAINEIDPNNNFFLDNTVLSLPLIAQSFTENDDEWEIANWQIVDGHAYFTGTRNLNEPNYLGLPGEAFAFAGYYFLHVIVPRLDSGVLKIYNTGGDVLAEIDSYGTASFEITVTDPTIAGLKIVAEGVFPGEIIRVSSVWLHRVTPRLKEYMKFLFLDGGGMGISRQELETAIAESNELTQQLITDLIFPISDNLQIHLESTNPHGINCDLIGASKVGHTHTPDEVGLGDVPTDISDAINLDSSTTIASSKAVHDLLMLLTNELDHKSEVGHTHTAVEVSAAPIDHTHTLNSLNAAAKDHSHLPEDIGAADRIHTHDEYTTEEEVNSIIATALNDLENLTTPSLSPLTISAYEQGSLPIGMEESSLTPPICPVIFPYIVHQSSGEYDYYEGQASTNIPTIDGHAIQYAFKKHLTEADHTANVAAFLSANEILSPEVLVEYYFHTEREIDAYTFFKDSTSAIGGVPEEWILIVDGEVVRTTGADFAGWYSSADFVKDTLTSPIRGRRFSFVISKVHLDASMHWGMRIEFSFSDVSAGKIATTSPISIASATHAGVRTLDIEAIPEIDPGISEINTPLYLFIQYNGATDAEYIVSPLRAEFSEIQSGIPGLMDKFSGKTNVHWGTVSVTSEDPAHPVENLYKENMDFFLSENATEVTITHEFVTSMVLVGHRIVFSDDVIAENAVPDEWEFKVEYSDGTQVIVETVNGYLPAIGDGTKDRAWWIKKYPTYHRNVVKYILTMRGTKGQTKLGMWKLIPMFESAFYNIRTCSMEPENLFPLGKIEYVKAYDNSWEGFIHSGVVLGDYCHVPIDHFNAQPQGIKTHYIPNPFNTKRIDFTVFSLSVNGSNPVGSVEQIDEDYIKFVSMSAGRYSLRISRIW